MTTVYPSIAAPSKTLPSLHTSFMQARQTITLLTVNAQLPSQSTLTKASQIFATPEHVANAINEIGPGAQGPKGDPGPAGATGPAGPPGVGFPDAPANGTTYGRNNNAWQAVSGGGGGGITDAPADSTSYARNNSAWIHLTHNDITDWAASVPAAYVLPIASPTVLGGVKIDGTSITIASGVISATPGVAPSNVLPVINGTAAAGASALYSRGDHVHPVDTSRYAASNPAGYITSASVPVVSTTLPVMDGTATIGASGKWADGAHIHPTDTSRYAASNPSGYQTAANVTASLASYAPLASPVLTGNPTAPTQTAGDNDTSIATTAFVTTAVTTAVNAIPAAPSPSNVAPAMDTGATGTIGTSLLYARADHIHPDDSSKYDASNPSGFQTAAQVTAVLPVASSTTPVMNGAAAVGIATTYARADHVHPSDTSRLALTGGTMTGNLKIGVADAALGLFVTGATHGVRFVANATYMSIEGVDQTGVGSYQPLNLMGSAITTSALFTTKPSAAATAGFNVPHGVAPTTPVNGDAWTTTAGFFVCINGATVGPLTGAGVNTFNTRAGAVTLLTADVTAAMPAFTGDVTSAAGAVVNTLATVNANVGTFQGLTVNGKGLVTAAVNQGYAPLTSPTFTGTPAAPTATAGTNTTQLATTAFVGAAVTTGAYTLPTASTTVLGGVKVDGTTVTIASGVISAAGGGGAAPSTTTPIMDGTGAVGTGTTYARADHVHPSDTSRAPIAGITDGSNAAAGQRGEVLSSVVTSAITLTTGTFANVTSLVLTAGDWDVQGEVWFAVGTGAATSVQGNISTTSLAAPSAPALNTARGVQYNINASGVPVIALKPCRVNVTTPTTMYLTCAAGFPSGTTTATGLIWARRVR